MSDKFQITFSKVGKGWGYAMGVFPSSGGADLRIEQADKIKEACERLVEELKKGEIE